MLSIDRAFGTVQTEKNVPVLGDLKVIITADAGRLSYFMIKAI